MEKILEIVEYSESDTNEEFFSNDYSGFAIVTNKQTIKLLINDEQQCCEDWGYFMSEDDFNDFIGAELIELKLTDTELKEGLLHKHDVSMDAEWYEGDVMFVDLVTSEGVLQFVAYNNHNGYYGHKALVVSEQLNHEEYL